MRHTWFGGIVALMLSSSVGAQGLAAPWQTAVPIYMGTAIQLNMMNSVRQSQQAASSRTGRTTARPRNWAVVSRDATVTRQVRANFLQGLAKQCGQPVSGEVDQRLGDVRTTFGRVVAPYGLHADDFVDVTAAYMVILWMAANRQVQLPTVAQVQGVRLQMRTLPALRLDDAQKRQEFAEIMMYQTCMGVIVREQAEAQGKPELLDALGAELDRKSSQGAELRKLRLTDKGFLPR